MKSRQPAISQNAAAKKGRILTSQACWLVEEVAHVLLSGLI